MIFFIFYLFYFIFLGEEKEKWHGKYSNHFAFFNTPKLDPKIDFRKKVNLYMSFSFLTGKIK